MGELTNVRVVEKRKILKYASGVDPRKGPPFEIVEEEKVYTGLEALKFLGLTGHVDKDRKVTKIERKK